MVPVVLLVSSYSSVWKKTKTGVLATSEAGECLRHAKPVSSFIVTAI